MQIFYNLNFFFNIKSHLKNHFFRFIFRIFQYLKQWIFNTNIININTDTTQQNIKLHNFDSPEQYARLFNGAHAF